MARRRDSGRSQARHQGFALARPSHSRTAPLPFHSRQIYSCGLQRASVEDGDNSMRAAAYNNPNRPGTHLPRKTAPHRPSFLIPCPELDTGLTCTKQRADPVSNRQFFAFLKLPDTASRRDAITPIAPYRGKAKEAATHVSRGRGEPRPYEKQKQIPHTVRQKRAIGFGMTSDPLPTAATSIAAARNVLASFERKFDASGGVQKAASYS